MASQTNSTNEDPKRKNMIPSWMPRIGMKFNSTHEAWNFWTFYGGQIGFDVRVNYENKSKLDGVVTSARYVCSNEGYRARDKRDNNTRRPRAETRTGCDVRMGITIDREIGNYEVHDLVLEHNHVLQLPETCHLMPSQRKITSLQAFEIETADDSGIVPKAAHELASRQVGGPTKAAHAVKHLPQKKKEEDAPNVLAEFSACMYKYEDDEAFEEAFTAIRIKVDTQIWLDSIYKVKKKWARCYMRNAYTLGMRSTQLSESLNSDLKNHLKSDLDILRFFKHLESVVQGKRDNELNEEYESRKKLPRVRIRTPAIIQASKVYTPRIFEDFQNEYERSISAYIKPSEENNVYNIAIASLDPESTYEEESKVLVDYEGQQVFCSCGQFERVGILCSHALKALDVMNIKYLPSQYILKRWTREARSGTIQDSHGNIVVEDPRMEDTLRLKFYIRKFHGIASKALASEECIKLLDDALESLSNQVEEKVSVNTCRTEAICEEPDISLQTACLKKKETEKKNSRRKKSWIDKQHPNKKKKKTTKLSPEKQYCSRGEKDTVAANHQATSEQPTGTNENGFQEYEWMARLLMSNGDSLDFQNCMNFPGI